MQNVPPSVLDCDALPGAREGGSPPNHVLQRVRLEGNLQRNRVVGTPQDPHAADLLPPEVWRLH